MPPFPSEFRDFDANAAWHVVHTRHQHEKAVAEILTNNGFEVFLPLHFALHRWADRIKRVSLPLFPCYVFLRGGLDKRIQIVKTPGVHGIVTAGGQPGVVPEEEILGIRRAVENFLAAEPYPYLNVGDRVRVTSGPLLGIEGILIRKQDHLKIVLSVEMLGRSIAVEIDGATVESAGRSHPINAGNPGRTGIPACY